MYLIHQSGPVVGWNLWSLTIPDPSNPEWLLTDAADVGRSEMEPWPIRTSQDREVPENNSSSIPNFNPLDGYWDKSSLAPLPYTLDILSSSAPTVCGEVIGWGTIKESEQGWIATKIYPFRLGLICFDCLREHGILWPPQQVWILPHWTGTGVRGGIATCSQHTLERMEGASLDGIPVRSIPARTVEATLLAKYAISRADLPTLEEDPLLFLNEMEDDPLLFLNEMEGLVK